MLCKASEIKVYLVVEYVGKTIEDEIEEFLENHPNKVIIDIKFAIMQNGEKVNEVYREALIIYKEVPHGTD
ncbi:sporulation protein Cse60 [Paenibacillus naphthalenovorans]|uniref:Uncharacterized protein n=1 Tax=Paenibacillus naphthalenovorans TaxID=162209 RepID=A0A0U2MWC2_9BACL|nr:sporulation protein Cse60 [Paenibacillus naphthalenovorans]ALS22159.1 hypothetical protein IJ22_17850 [Paenibacillus naphthalenovorans]